MTSLVEHSGTPSDFHFCYLKFINTVVFMKSTVFPKTMIQVAVLHCASLFTKSDDMLTKVFQSQNKT